MAATLNASCSRVNKMCIAHMASRANNLFMDDVIRRIDARLAETGKTWADLGRAVGASDQRTYNWRSRGLPKSALKPVADFLGWSVDKLLTGQDSKRNGEPTPPPVAVYETPAEYRTEGAIPLPAKHQAIPVVGTAQLGNNGYWAELEYPVGHGDGYVNFYSSDPNAYALLCKGDSMAPRIKDGEFVVVEPNATPHPGDEVMVKSEDGRVMIKELLYVRDGLVHLASVNEAHGRITIPVDQVAAMHLVAGIAKRMRWRPD